MVDAVAAPLAFLTLDALWGPRWAALSALVVAYVSAVVMGQGRAFYLPELLINAVGLVVCVGSLLANRAITGVVCRKVGIEGRDLARDPRSVRRHRLLTAAWTGLWIAHLVPLVLLYALDSLVGLTVLATVVDKPTMLAMAVITVVVTRRGVAHDGAQVALGAPPAVRPHFGH